MKNTIICLFYSTTNCFKNKQVLKEDETLTDILNDFSKDTLIGNTKENWRNQFVLQNVAKSFLDAYFHSVPMENNTYPNKVKEHKNARKELEGLEIFGNSKILISKPKFQHSTNEVQITLFYYYNDENPQAKDFVQHHYLKESKVLELCKSLSSLVFKKKVNLNLIRVRYPYMNSQILAQYLVSNANTNTFLHFSESILTYPSLTPGMFGKIGEENSYVLSSYITDIRLELSGRLTTEQVVPRLTKKSARISNPNTNIGSSLTDCGLSSESMKNTLVDYGKYSSKNEMGTFMLKVWITSVQCIEKD